MRPDTSYKTWLKRVYSLILETAVKNRSLFVFDSNTKAIGFGNVRENYMLYTAAHNTARMAKTKSGEELWKFLSMDKTYQELCKAARRVQKQKDLRKKRADAKKALDSGNIFFICSAHGNPRKEHKDWQGRIYVNRFWRTKVSGKDYAAVAEYVKEHKIRSVQWAIGTPLYLTTAPYCKHYFIPVGVSSVLDGTWKETIRKESHKWYDYYAVRSEILNYARSVFEKLNDK